jgi:hypothetical protein
MVTFPSYRADCAPFVPFPAPGLHDPSNVEQTECERSPTFTVVDGLVSVTRKAWFSRHGSDDNDRNRVAQ